MFTNCLINTFVILIINASNICWEYCFSSYNHFTNNDFNSFKAPFITSGSFRESILLCKSFRESILLCLVEAILLQLL